MIHVQSRFKPFVSIGLEYQKITPTAGNSQLGNEVIFSIPQFGDFLADMVLNMNLSTASCVAGVLPAVPADPADIASTAGVAFTINHIAAVVIPALFGLVWLVSPAAVFLMGAAMALVSLVLARNIPLHPSPGNEVVFGKVRFAEA